METLFDDNMDITGERIIDVALASGADMLFSYMLPDKLGDVMPGTRVEVPLGRSNRTVTGFCVTVKRVDRDDQQRIKYKKVKAVLDEKPLLDEHLMKLGKWISEYYVCPLGQVLAAMVPAAVRKGAGVTKRSMIHLTEDYASIKLTSPKQQNLVDHLEKVNAFDEDRAVDKIKTLEAAGLTEAVLRTLIRHNAVKLTRREVLNSLPALPEGLMLTRAGFEINEHQRMALEDIAGAVDSGHFAVRLLHGVTDSGKTEVYIRAIEKTIQAGKDALVLVPEIALTAQTVERFAVRFEKLAVMHSGLTDAQRNSQWQKVRAGKANVVIGARSAVFAPLPDLGLVVVDEEHDSSYKQDNAPCYNGRDAAIKRAQLKGAVCILGSATPSLETLHNCTARKHYKRLTLPHRVSPTAVPEMEVVDMTRCITTPGRELISERLENLLTETTQKGEQAILLLNRRGYSSYVVCKKCGHCLTCRNCDVTLTFHKRTGKGKHFGRTGHVGFGTAVCHHCLASQLVPKNCPLCGAVMSLIGAGSQQLEEQIAKILPSANVLRVDTDSMRSRDYYQMLDAFGRGEIDILAGTQILAKGLHFPNVTLVGIVNADTALSVPDFRANERTFQLISQVAGRAGRGDKPGKVIVQTFMKESRSIQAAVRGDYEGFARTELTQRKEMHLPPCWRMAVINLRDEKYDKLETAANDLKARIDGLIERNKLDINADGPFDAIINRVTRKHRMQIILQSPDVITIQNLLSALRKLPPIRPAVHILFDVDPLNML